VDDSAKPVTLPADVISVLSSDARIGTVELTGSRARGEATPLSDWDFAVTARQFDELPDALAEIVRPLRPVVGQWDRLSPIWCYMLILAGPVKVDLLFSHPHRPEAPWPVEASTLAGIDGHFWDWALWLRSKEAAGRQAMVAAELEKMHQHLLAPMGVTLPPASVADAVSTYREARGNWEGRLQSFVPRNAETTVMPVLRQ
jgi:predicted nucleotidyltransferase